MRIITTSPSNPQVTGSNSFVRLPATTQTDKPRHGLAPSYRGYSHKCPGRIRASTGASAHRCARRHPRRSIPRGRRGCRRPSERAFSDVKWHDRYAHRINVTVTTLVRSRTRPGAWSDIRRGLPVGIDGLASPRNGYSGRICPARGDGRLKFDCRRRPTRVIRSYRLFGPSRPLCWWRLHHPVCTAPAY